MAKAHHIAGIDCNASVMEAIRAVLIARLSEMCSLRDRALDWSDPEGVHDMRVSSRRLRGALDDFGPYLRKRSLSEALQEIKDLADALGEVRDQDVAIIGLQKLSAGAPEEVSTVLKYLISGREIIRKNARSELRRSLSKTALGEIQQSFENALDTAIRKGRSRKQKAKGGPTYLEVARIIVSQRLKELDRLSDGFYHPLKVKPLHRMRIAAKHLRYALELFEQCLGPNSATFARKVAGLQSSLGELHDADIWIAAFGEQVENAEGQVSNSHVAGSLWLLSHFVKLHSKHLRNALARWEDWERNDVSKQLRELLAAKAKDDPVDLTADQSAVSQHLAASAKPSEREIGTHVAPARTGR